MTNSNMLRKIISDAKVNHLFPVISKNFGYNAAQWADEITTLIELWKQQGYVEIDQTQSDRKHGLIKDSSSNEKGFLCPFYIGLFHAR
jgi:hypothetical protein